MKTKIMAKITEKSWDGKILDDFTMSNDWKYIYWLSWRFEIGVDIDLLEMDTRKFHYHDQLCASLFDKKCPYLKINHNKKTSFCMRYDKFIDYKGDFQRLSDCQNERRVLKWMENIKEEIETDDGRRFGGDFCGANCRYLKWANDTPPSCYCLNYKGISPIKMYDNYFHHYYDTYPIFRSPLCIKEDSL